MLETIQSFLESVLGSLGNADVSAIFQSIVETISGFIGSFVANFCKQRVFITPFYYFELVAVM